MTQLDERKKKFIEQIANVGAPVVRQLLLETIDLAKPKAKKNKLKQELDRILPAVPLSARNIMFGGKTYYLVFRPCPDIKEYSMDAELDKVRKIIPEEQQDYFMKEVGITLSVIPNIYQKIIEDNEDFAELLVESLPENKKNIFSNLIECETSTVSMYEDGLRFALYIDDLTSVEGSRPA